MMERLQANLAQLRLWSDNCPDNFLAKRLMVEAEIARVTGNAVAAADLYDQAIQAAHEAQFVHEEALANELAARFVLESRPASRAGAMYLRDARYGYALWGAQRKVEELETEFPRSLAGGYQDARVPNAAPATVDGTRSSTTRSGTAHLDLD